MARPRTEATVLIVDDHRVFAETLALSLNGQAGFTVIGTTHTADSAVEQASRRRPDVVILDIRLGEDDGLSAARRIRAELPDVLIVVVSARDDWAWVARAASAGANGYAPKSGSLTELVGVLRAVRAGKFLIAPSFRRQPVKPPVDEPAVTPLTSREAQVLSLLGDGISPTQIARILNISVNTCRGYVKSMYAKLGVGSQLEALAIAWQHNLIEHTHGLQQ